MTRRHKCAFECALEKGKASAVEQLLRAYAALKIPLSAELLDAAFQKADTPRVLECICALLKHVDAASADDVLRAKCACQEANRRISKVKERWATTKRLLADAATPKPRLIESQRSLEDLASRHFGSTSAQAAACVRESARICDVMARLRDVMHYLCIQAAE